MVPLPIDVIGPEMRSRITITLMYCSSNLHSKLAQNLLSLRLNVTKSLTCVRYSLFITPNLLILTGFILYKKKTVMGVINRNVAHISILINNLIL